MPPVLIGLDVILTDKFCHRLAKVIIGKRVGKAHHITLSLGNIKALRNVANFLFVPNPRVKHRNRLDTEHTEVFNSVIPGKGIIAFIPDAKAIKV